MTTTTTERLSPVETAREMRKALKAAWPTVKFSVTGTRGSGAGWLNVAWTDGPTDDAVRAITLGFQSSQFSGMDDSYHATGETRYSCRGVCAFRDHSPEAEQWARAQVAAHPGRWHCPGWDPVDPTDPDYYAVHRLLNETDLTTVTL